METALRVINIVKVRLLQHIVQNITAIYIYKKKIDWRNFYNPVQVSLNANRDAKMTL